jgi:hypothetical protein
MNIIELTLVNRTKIFLNLNNITYYYTDNNGKTTVAYIDGKLSAVLETADDINKLIYDRTKGALNLVKN